MRTNPKAPGVWHCAACVLITSALIVTAWTCAVVRKVNAADLPGCCTPASGAPYAPSVLFGSANHGCMAGATWTSAACAGTVATPTPTPPAEGAGPWCYSGGVCYPVTGTCFGEYIPAGGVCPPASAPTPTPTPTPTATPTPPPIPITLRQLPYMPFPFSYQYQVPWIQRQPDGSLVITSNAGHYPDESLTPPALGVASTWPGECKVAVYFPADGGTPQARQTYCSSQTTTVWETGDYMTMAQTTPSEVRAYGVLTERPVGPIGGDTDRDVQLEMLTFTSLSPGVPAMLSPNPSRVTLLAQKGVNFWPLGVIDLAGHQMMYTSELYKLGTWPSFLRRYRIGQYGRPEPDPSFPSVPMAQVGDGRGPLNLVLAHDGRRLFVTDGAWPATMACRLWQSTDWGQNWSSAGIEIPAPEGSVGIAQCGIAVDAGGIAFDPLWGLCQTFWSQAGDDGLDWSRAGDWRPYVWSQEGASLPPNLFTPAAAYPPATPTPISKAAQAKAVTTRSPEPRWLPGAVLRPTPSPTPTP